ncbi:terpene synthase family protein [Herpetosiphon giganteus]|uniref:terpene synthase family protein n=1 Tax=Herpetosiphon giganteus TaxID=2029754 RepID=UPI001957F9C9|nr:hypothetical protein [Herpetosiphon giganteus]MBM7845200.1 hypothetical protein [Herpetosiphon giganteus]
MPTRLLSLPDITGIGACAINPFQAQSIAATTAICEAYGIALPAMQHYITMSSYLFPTASLERLKAIDLLNAILFYIDDMYDRNQHRVPIHLPSPATYAHCVGLFVDGMLPTDGHHLYPIWYEAYRQFRDLSTRDYRQRLAESLMTHLQATQIPNRTFLQATATTDMYIATRLHDSGMYPTMILIEFALGQPIARDIYTHPAMQRATELTALIGALLNDLFSYEKEVLHLDSRFNLVRILMDAEQLSFAQAVHQSITMINQWIAKFETIAQPSVWFPGVQHAQANRYVDGLRQQIAAAWHWQLATNRYRSPNSPFPILRNLLPDDER